MPSLKYDPQTKALQPLMLEDVRLRKQWDKSLKPLLSSKSHHCISDKSIRVEFYQLKTERFPLFLKPNSNSYYSCMPCNLGCEQLKVAKEPVHSRGKESSPREFVFFMDISHLLIILLFMHTNHLFYKMSI